MRTLQALGAIALADFRERTRRESFLVALALVGWLAFAVASRRIVLHLDTYEGVMNAAWLGSLIALVVCVSLGWLGFFLINSSIELDRRTGTGEILAASPISRVQYTVAKWLSNLAVLALLVVLLMTASVFLHWRAMQQSSLDLRALLAPIVMIAGPLIALTAACAVLFESVRFLKGGLGTAVWLFGFLILVPVSMHWATGRFVGLDLFGFKLLIPSMGAAAKAAFPAYRGGFALGIVPQGEPQLFHWAGLEWPAWIVMQRLLWLLVAAALALLAAAFFDRFDPAVAASVQPRRGLTELPPESVLEPTHERPGAGMLPTALRRFALGYRLLAEVQLLLKGASRIWLVVALGLAVGGLFATSPDARSTLLLLAWIWPVLIWSSMGCREARAGTREFLFGCSHPLLLQLPAQWLAGFLVTVLAGSGVLLQLLIVGDVASLQAWLAAAVFIPSLALMLGVISGASKVFEVIYLLLCYIGPLNKVEQLDFIRMHAPSAPGVWLATAAASLGIALLWRWWQLNR